MITKLKENTLPRFLQGKTHRSMRIVRPVDLNSVIDEVNTELTAIIGNIATNAADIATNTADIATNTADIATNTADIATLQSQGGGIKLTKVLTEGELDTLGTVGVEILPAPVANAVYDVTKIQVKWDVTGQELTYNNAQANYLSFTRDTGSIDLAYLDGHIINNALSGIAINNAPNTWNDTLNSFLIGTATGLGENVWLQLANGVNPTKGGVGSVIPTCTIEVWYNLITF